MNDEHLSIEGWVPGFRIDEDEQLGDIVVFEDADQEQFVDHLEQGDEEHLVAAADGIAIVHLVELDGAAQRLDHEALDDLQREEGRAQLFDRLHPILDLRRRHLRPNRLRAQAAQAVRHLSIAVQLLQLRAQWDDVLVLC